MAQMDAPQMLSFDVESLINSWRSPGIGIAHRVLFFCGVPPHGVPHRRQAQLIGCTFIMLSLVSMVGWLAFDLFTGRLKSLYHGVTELYNDPFSISQDAKLFFIFIGYRCYQAGNMLHGLYAYYFMTFLGPGCGALDESSHRLLGKTSVTWAAITMLSLFVGIVFGISKWWLYGGYMVARFAMLLGLGDFATVFWLATSTELLIECEVLRSSIRETCVFRRHKTNEEADLDFIALARQVQQVCDRWFRFLMIATAVDILAVICFLRGDYMVYYHLHRRTSESHAAASHIFSVLVPISIQLVSQITPLAWFHSEVDGVAALLLHGDISTPQRALALHFHVHAPSIKVAGIVRLSPTQLKCIAGSLLLGIGKDAIAMIMN